MGNTFLTIHIFALVINVAMALFRNRLFPIGCDSKQMKKEKKHNHFSYFFFHPKKKERNKQTNKWRVIKCSARIRFNASAIWELSILHTMRLFHEIIQNNSPNWTIERTNKCTNCCIQYTKHKVSNSKKPFETLMNKRLSNLWWNEQ